MSSDAPFHQECTKNTPEGQAPETRYVVRTPDGTPVAIHIRVDTPAGKKVWWERPDGQRGLGGVRVEDLPLYAVERLGDAREVVVAEGEKATDALLGIGIAAVGTVTGAHATPSAESLRPIAGRTVILWPDNDAPGRDHMTRVATRLADLGARDIHLVEWADAPVGGDAADFLARGATREDVRHLMLTARRWTPPPTPTSDAARPRVRERDATELIAAELPAELPALSLLGRDGYVIEGWSHLLAGYPKAGKTELVYACVRDWVRAGRAVLWITEESELVWQYRLRRDTTLPRGLRLVFGLGERPDRLLERAVEGEESIVIVDTIRSLLGITDEADNAELARVIGLWELGLRGKTRLYLHHLRKGLGDHGLAVAGGTMLVGAVDRVLELRHDEHGPQRRVVRVISRIVGAPDLLLGLDDAGWPVALGDPGAVELDRVAQACLDVVEPETWLKTSEVRERLPEPQPSHGQVLRALRELHTRGAVERDPQEERPRATYRWRLAPTAASDLNFARIYNDRVKTDAARSDNLSLHGNPPCEDRLSPDTNLSSHGTYIYSVKTDDGVPCRDCGATMHSIAEGEGWECPACLAVWFPARPTH